MMMELANTSETLVNFYQVTQHIPEDSHLHACWCENLFYTPVGAHMHTRLMLTFYATRLLEHSKKETYPLPVWNRVLSFVRDNSAYCLVMIVFWVDHNNLWYTAITSSSVTCTGEKEEQVITEHKRSKGICLNNKQVSVRLRPNTAPLSS
jgi:hypothetical protein